MTRDPRHTPQPHDVVHVDGHDLRVALVLAGTNVFFWLDGRDKTMCTCVELEKSPAKMQPKDAVKMLRLELHGGNVSHVIQALSRIDFSRTSAGKTDVAHGKESLGRSVEAAVQQADGVPETFTVAVPVWSAFGFDRYSVQVQFGLYLDLQAQKVELRVLGDEIERVVGLATHAVAADLREALPSVPVFMGEP